MRSPILRSCHMLTPPTRRGIILPIVLVILVLLAMLALGFGVSTRAEYQALAARTNMLQARLCALSGLEGAALVLRQQFADPSMWYSNPNVFRDQVVEADVTIEKKKTSWRFSLVAYNYYDDDRVRYGLTDEAGKLNINVASPDQLRRLLARNVPAAMIEPLVDALLDWREEGDQPRPAGAKDAYYLNLSQPYRCKKAPLDTLEELLLVRGFDSAMVFGEDMNRNGLLEDTEDDGDKSLPLDNGNGVLDRGLYPYVTVYSREPEVTDGNPYMPRVNISIFPDVARGRVRDEIVDFIIEAAKAKVDFGKTPANLVGMTFTKDGKETASPATLEDLPAIMDVLTTGYHVHEDGHVYGRINVNTAPRAILATIGKLTPEEIDAMVKTRTRLDAESTKTIAWLATENVLSLEKFKEVAYLFTARSYQFMVESVGYNDYDGMQCRLQAVMELRLPRVQAIYYRDLSSLGRSYKLSGLDEGHGIIPQDIFGGGL